MKYLRKFATEAEIDVDASPNVVLVAESGEVKYNVPMYKNGVYIQHIDGRLYTTDEWTAMAFANEAANGVAVIADECSFVIAKEDCGKTTWGSQKFVEGVTIVDSSNANDARYDYAGKANTDALLVAGSYPAAQACAGYTFPNGQKGYLGGSGEWYIATPKNRSKINAALAKIGGTTPDGFYWSSTQRNAKNAWRRKWEEDLAYNEAKNKNSFVRAFAPLNI